MKARINGKPVEFTAGETILEAALRSGWFIPSLCALMPKRHAPGTCRICMVECRFPSGGTEWVPACRTPFEEGMDVCTDSPEVRARQRLQAGLLLADHDLHCETCARGGDCELQDVAAALGLAGRPFNLVSERRCDREATAALIMDRGKCVRCLRCVETCRQTGLSALTPERCGIDACIGFNEAAHWADSPRCISCGQCTRVCPTGAIAEKSDVDAAFSWLSEPGTVVAFTPSLPGALRAALADSAGHAAGFPFVSPAAAADLTGWLAAVLRRLGAAAVCSAAPAFVEAAGEIAGAVRNTPGAPVFLTSCPAWVTYARRTWPGLELMSGIEQDVRYREIFNARLRQSAPALFEGGAPRTIWLTPCLTAKAEPCSGNELFLTVREVMELIRRGGLAALDVIEPLDVADVTDIRTACNPDGADAADPGREGILAEVMAALGGSPLVPAASAQVWEGTAQVAGRTLRAVRCHGLEAARRLVSTVLDGSGRYDLIEVLACPGGCHEGGGAARIRGSIRQRGSR